MANGVSIDIKTGVVTNTTVDPVVTPVASLQQEALAKRTAEFNLLLHRVDRHRRETDEGLTTTDTIGLLNSYGTALADITVDAAWGTDPIAVVDAVILMRPI